MSRITIRRLEARGVLVPMRRAPVTGSGGIDGAPLVLVDLHTDAGITGRAYLFAFTRTMLAPTVATLAALDDLVVEHDAAPLALDASLRRRLTRQDTHGALGQRLAA
ncbi:MAG: mandelate racemase, partial [Gammaproteobacteria bacterium]